MTLDYEDRLMDYLDTLRLQFRVMADSNSADESISVVSMPGSLTIRQYQDGAKDKRFTHFIRIKAKDTNRNIAEDTLQLIASALSDVEELPSQNDSYEFNVINITNEPYLFQVGTDGFIYFQMSIQTELTIF